MKGDSNGVFERKRTGDVRGRHLTCAVTEDRRGLDPPRPPQCRKSDLQRKDRRLPISRFSEQRALLIRRELFQQRPAGEGDEKIAHLLDRSAEDRLIGEKLAS